MLKHYKHKRKTRHNYVKHIFLGGSFIVYTLQHTHTNTNIGNIYTCIIIIFNNEAK